MVNASSLNVPDMLSLLWDFARIWIDFFARLIFLGHPLSCIWAMLGLFVGLDGGPWSFKKSWNFDVALTDLPSAPGLNTLRALIPMWPR